MPEVAAGGGGAFFFLRPSVSVPVPAPTFPDSLRFFRVLDGVGGFELPSEAELVDVYRLSLLPRPRSDPEAESLLTSCFVDFVVLVSSDGGDFFL